MQNGKQSVEVGTTEEGERRPSIPDDVTRGTLSPARSPTRSCTVRAAAPDDVTGDGPVTTRLHFLLSNLHYFVIFFVKSHFGILHWLLFYCTYLQMQRKGDPCGVLVRVLVRFGARAGFWKVQKWYNLVIWIADFRLSLYFAVHFCVICKLCSVMQSHDEDFP